MRRYAVCVIAGVFLFWGSLLHATIFGKIQGIVHDPQHRPIAGATVVLKATTSAFTQSTQTDADGQFTFTAITVGDYSVSVTQAGFGSSQQTVTVDSNASPILHFQLQLATVNQSATVSATPEATDMDSVTPTTLIDRADIAQTPGADRSNSLQMITDYVPGAYYTHDQLHIRGGHQVSWLIDGVPIPNTNIASNLGPQIDPKDIDYLEVQRGSYDASLGDRTYGEFNVVPRSGFERDNEAELVTTFGNWYQTNDQLNFGGHTEKFAYYASINGNRSNLGLQTPIGQVFHDAENGYGGFGTFLYNLDAKDQFRLVMQLRKDYYQIPYDPNPNSDPNTSGLRDGQHETDGFAAFTWVRTINPNMLLTVSPFYHHNTANYRGGSERHPRRRRRTTAPRITSAGSPRSARRSRGTTFKLVYMAFKQYDSEFFHLIFNDQTVQTHRSRTAKIPRVGRSRRLSTTDSMSLPG